MKIIAKILKNKRVKALPVVFAAIAGPFSANRSLPCSANNTRPFPAKKMSEFRNLKDRKNKTAPKKIRWMAEEERWSIPNKSDKMASI